MDIEPWTRIEALRAQAGDGSIVMLNLLKFKPGGFDQYMRYSDAAMPIVERHGARVLYVGTLDEKAHDDDAPEWEYLVVVHYPDIEAFARIVTDAEYQAAHADRAASVERALLRLSLPLAE